METDDKLIFKLNESVKGYLHYLDINGQYEKSLILRKIFKNFISDVFEYDLFLNDEVSDLNILSKLSLIIEYGSNNKKNGVYYTPNDLVEYMSYNAIYKYLSKDHSVKSISYIKKYIHSIDRQKLLKFCLKTVVLDPTSGAGEFTLEILKLKIKILKLIDELSEDNIISVVRSIYNNDISYAAILSVRYRFIIYLSDICEFKTLRKILTVLKNNNRTVDFIFNSKSIFNTKIDIMIGNPPYIEYRSLDRKPNNKYGNVYADILKNSSEMTSSSGIMCFVIPISFIATPRMKKIRKLLFDKYEYIDLLSFSDRPDSLFSSVHQKLNIFFGQSENLKDKCSIYTSKYYYWYKNERKKLFDNINLVINDDINDDFIPKYGNLLEKNIYKKISNKDNKPVSYFLKSKRNDDVNSIYLSLRSSFFVKSFIKKCNSNEYKKFNVEGLSNLVMISILNSSLFWFYWVIVSDGWHITNKELNNFTIPDIKDADLIKLENLAKLLLQKLEDTKEYIGTVQTEYEYKHKYCFDLINKIDDVLADIYGLDTVEKQNVINYEKKYREGRN